MFLTFSCFPCLRHLDSTTFLTRALPQAAAASCHANTFPVTLVTTHTTLVDTVFYGGTMRRCIQLNIQPVHFFGPHGQPRLERHTFNLSISFPTDNTVLTGQSSPYPRLSMAGLCGGSQPVHKHLTVKIPLEFSEERALTRFAKTRRRLSLEISIKYENDTKGRRKLVTTRKAK